MQESQEMKMQIKIIFTFISVLSLLFFSGNALAVDGITGVAIKNFSYNLVAADRTVQLKNGKYKSGNNPDNFICVKLVKYAIGDLNGDGVNDAVIVLAQNFMGSGTFFELTALEVKDGKIHQTKSISLGDRVVIKDLAISKTDNEHQISNANKIKLKMITHKATDPSCCPSLKVEKCFYLTSPDLKEYLRECYE